MSRPDTDNPYELPDTCRVVVGATYIDGTPLPPGSSTGLDVVPYGHDDPPDDDIPEEFMRRPGRAMPYAAWKRKK